MVPRRRSSIASSPLSRPDTPNSTDRTLDPAPEAGGSGDSAPPSVRRSGRTKSKAGKATENDGLSRKTSLASNISSTTTGSNKKGKAKSRDQEGTDASGEAQSDQTNLANGIVDTEGTETSLPTPVSPARRLSGDSPASPDQERDDANRMEEEDIWGSRRGSVMIENGGAQDSIDVSSGNDGVGEGEGDGNGNKEMNSHEEVTPSDASVSQNPQPTSISPTSSATLMNGSVGVTSGPHSSQQASSSDPTSDPAKLSQDTSPGDSTFPSETPSHQAPTSEPQRVPTSNASNPLAVTNNLLANFPQAQAQLALLQSMKTSLPVGSGPTPPQLAALQAAAAKTAENSSAPLTSSTPSPSYQPPTATPILQHTESASPSVTLGVPSRVPQAPPSGTSDLSTPSAAAEQSTQLQSSHPNQTTSLDPCRAQSIATRRNLLNRDKVQIMLALNVQIFRIFFERHQGTLPIAMDTFKIVIARLWLNLTHLAQMADYTATRPQVAFDIPANLLNNPSDDPTVVNRLGNLYQELRRLNDQAIALAQEEQQTLGVNPPPSAPAPSPGSTSPTPAQMPSTNSGESSNVPASASPPAAKVSTLVPVTPAPGSPNAEQQHLGKRERAQSDATDPGGQGPPAKRGRKPKDSTPESTQGKGKRGRKSSDNRNGASPSPGPSGGSFVAPPSAAQPHTSPMAPPPPPHRPNQPTTLNHPHATSTQDERDRAEEQLHYLQKIMWGPSFPSLPVPAQENIKNNISALVIQLRNQNQGNGPTAPSSAGMNGAPPPGRPPMPSQQHYSQMSTSSLHHLNQYGSSAPPQQQSVAPQHAFQNASAPGFNGAMSGLPTQSGVNSSLPFFQQQLLLQKQQQGEAQQNRTGGLPPSAFGSQAGSAAFLQQHQSQPHLQPGQNPYAAMAAASASRPPLPGSPLKGLAQNLIGPSLVNSQQGAPSPAAFGAGMYQGAFGGQTALQARGGAPQQGMTVNPQNLFNASNQQQPSMNWDPFLKR